METKDKKAKVCVVAERLAFLVGRRVTVFIRGSQPDVNGLEKFEAVYEDAFPLGCCYFVLLRAGGFLRLVNTTDIAEVGLREVVGEAVPSPEAMREALKSE